ncbi:MAG TPA: hypothetical protein VFT84_09460 [Gemmatimonadales bacterium]|nr:hypothetical protein [Gemmatimonadales bacterium]
MTTRHRLRGRLACSLALAGILLAMVATASDAQARRRLQSRAAFAALDSSDLADSSGMRPMRPKGAQDSVLLDMLAFLEESAGRRHGIQGTRMRKWDGFGSQAHPDLGILVDSLELADLLSEVMSLKGAGGMPRDTAEARLIHVLRFLVAHEYAHLMQYKVFGRTFMDDPDSTRVIECGADLLGGINYWVFMKRRVGGQPYPKGAFDTVRDFGYVVGSSNWLDGTEHPQKEDRRLCIAKGTETAGLLDSLDAVRTGRADSETLEAVRHRREAEPELADGTLDVMQWSRMRAHSLGAAGGGVVGGSKELDVVRDSSVSRLVRVLADAAVAGAEALRAFRAGSSPGDSTAFLLRQSLDPPWECTTRERLKAEEATCLEDLRTGPAAREAAFRSLIRGVEQGLPGPAWRRAALEPSEPGAPGRSTEGDQVVVFMHGGVPNDGDSPRVTITLSQGEMASVSQLPPRFMLSLTVRSAAAE